MFPCVAKGRRYYDGAPNVEASMLHAALPRATRAGFFCNGEVGPTPVDELQPEGTAEAHMMGYSSGGCGAMGWDAFLSSRLH